MHDAAGDIDELLPVSAISNAAPPSVKSVAQQTSPSSISMTVAIRSSSSVSSLLTLADSRTVPSPSITTQWCVRLPASIPAQSVGMKVVLSIKWLASLSMTTPARPYPAIDVATLNQRSSHQRAAGGHSQ